MTCERCGRTRKKYARGLCNPCYQTCRKQGQFGTPMVEITLRMCARCGVKTPSGLCRDCISVTRDLGELKAWAS